MGTPEQVRLTDTVCMFSDANTCRITAHVRDGILTQITPANFSDPVCKGACEKGLLAHHWVYHKDRIRHPLKRVGARGEGKWQRISWEEALDEITEKIKQIAETVDPGAMAWFIPGYPFLRMGGYTRLISLLQGTWIDQTGFGDLAGPTADFVTFGGMFSGYYYSRLSQDPELILTWGINPADTQPHRMRAIRLQKKKGCKVIAIDPRYTATASLSDEHIPIRPGTDGALALGMIHVILKEGLEDTDFIVRNTVGPCLVRADNGLFLRQRDLQGAGAYSAAAGDRLLVWDRKNNLPKPAEATDIDPALHGRYALAPTDCSPAFQLLADKVAEYTPEKVSEITDVPEDIIRRLAMEYATLKPAAIYRGMGMQRTFYGDLACRAINTLAAVTGNLNLQRPPFFALNLPSFLMPAGEYRKLPIMLLPDAISQEKPFPIKGLFLSGNNYVNQLPNAKRIVNELIPRLDLIAVCELFMTETAKYADYVLPSCSFFEDTDLVQGFLMPYLQLQQKVIEPLYESKSNFQIARELGRRMGLGQYFDKTDEEYIREILASDHPSMKDVTLERLRKEPLVARGASEPLEQLPTPTGRVEFYVERLRSFGQELPGYLEPLESVRQEKAKIYPFSLLTHHPRYRTNSMLANCPELLKFDPEPALEMNPVDAGGRNIRDGDVVDVFNDLSRVRVKAQLTEKIKAGVVSLAQGWWPENYMSGHHNELSHDRINPVQKSLVGPNAAYFDILVDVQRVEQG